MSELELKKLESWNKELQELCVNKDVEISSLKSKVETLSEIQNDFKLLRQQRDEARKYVEVQAAMVTALNEKLRVAKEALEYYANCPYIFDEADHDTEQLDLSKPWRHTSGFKARQALKQLEQE